MKLLREILEFSVNECSSSQKKSKDKLLSAFTESGFRSMKSARHFPSRSGKMKTSSMMSRVFSRFEICTAEKKASK